MSVPVITIKKNFNTRMVEFYRDGKLIRQREMANWEKSFKDETPEPEIKTVTRKVGCAWVTEEIS